MLCESGEILLDVDVLEWVDWGDSCVLIREYGVREVYERIVVSGNSLIMEGKIEVVVCFLNLVVVVEMDKDKKEF